MSDKIKRKIEETKHYKLIRVTYLDFGYMDRRRYRHYNIIEKSTNKLLGMFSNLKLAKIEIKNMEVKINE